MFLELKYQKEFFKMTNSIIIMAAGASSRMKRSLDEFVIDGVTTTIPLHKILLNHKKFIDSDFNVSWLDNEKVI